MRSQDAWGGHPGLGSWVAEGMRGALERAACGIGQDGYWTVVNPFRKASICALCSGKRLRAEDVMTWTVPRGPV